MTRLSSSDTEASPLREIENGRVQNRPSISITSLEHVHQDNASMTSSDGENNWKDSTDGENSWKGPNRATKADAVKIRSAVRRASSVHAFGTNGTPIYSASRTQRRRSPTAATAGSPPNENMFTIGQARRMMIGGRSEREIEWKVGVLSPRVAGVVGKASTRRTTMGEGKKERDSLSVVDRLPQHRLSSVVGMNSSAMRGSLLPGGKGVWR